MKRIVVPTDFSDCAMSALKVAAQISDKTNAIISLAHTYILPVYGFTDGHVMYNGKELGKIKHEIKRELQRIAKLEFIKHHVVEQYLLPEYSVDQIVSHSILKDADLIVMGTNGTSGIRDFLGSNTDRLLRKANCPVMVVKEGDEINFNPKDIVFASRFYGESYEHFPSFKLFADLYKSKIHLLYVNTPSEFNTTKTVEKLMLDFKDKFNLKNVTLNIFNDKTVEDGVINFSKRIKAGLLAIETHGRTGINHIINGSITEDLANHISLPVLTYRIKRQSLPTGVIFPDMR